MPAHTLYLTNLASLRSRGHRGPGRVLSAMARPTRWVVEAVDGRVPDLAPTAQANAAIITHKRAGTMTPEMIAEYRAGVEAKVGRHTCEPGRLGYTDSHTVGYLIGPVEGGDTIVCTCPRPDSPRRTHECHLEWVAPILTAAGWRVVLYGEEMS
jgi:hypothetical protein